MRSIFPYIFIALSIGLFMVFVRPMYKDISLLRGDVTAYNLALAHSTDLQKVRDDLASKYSNITGANKERLSHFLPNSVDNIQLMLELEKMASARGMILKNITFAPPSSIDDTSSGVAGYGTFDMQFRTQASYETFSLFLKDLEHNLRQIDVKGISFSVSDASKQVGLPQDTYEFSLKIKTYWLKY